jgi:hypothetical protein
VQPLPVSLLTVTTVLLAFASSEADGCGFKNWVLLNQECCTPKTIIRIRVSVLFSFVGVKSEFSLKFYTFLHFMNFKVVVM